jgi:hypothetical protein
MRKFVLTMTSEEYLDLMNVVHKAHDARIRPAVKVLNMLDMKTRLVVDEDEPASPEDAAQEPPEEPQESPAPSHRGMRPKRGRRQSS